MRSFETMKQEIDAHYPLYINGEWVEGEGGRMDVACPANGEKLCAVSAASSGDVDRAVRAARAAFPAWRSLPLPRRYDALMEIHGRIVRNMHRLCVAESLETGRPLPVSENMLTMGREHFPYFAALIRSGEDGTNSESCGMRVMVIREPIGVVGAVCAWNVPLLLDFWKLAPALAAGNCVVLKPSSFTPVGTMEFMKLIDGVLPPGVLNVVNGRGSITGQALLEHPGIDKLTFTGSTSVGMSVGLAAARRVIPATLELGGKSAGIYFADMDEQDLSRAVDVIASGALVNSGQVCAMQSRVLVEEPLYDTLVERVAERLRSAGVGAPWREGMQMGPVANREQMNSILEYVSIGRQEGARLVTGGERLTQGELASGFYIAPTLFADVDNAMRIAQEEIFGPVLSFIRFRDEQDAIRIANDSRYGLSGGVFTGDLRKALRVAEAVRTGTMRINGAAGRTMGGSAFGGYKASGIGRECYRTTLDAFSQLKTIAFPY